MDEEVEADVKYVDIEVFTPHIREHVAAIINEGRFGLSHREVEVLNPRSSHPNYTDQDTDCDRFQLVIPYAGTPLECMIIFQNTSPDCPPDFIFSDPRFFVPFDEIGSLAAWDEKNPDALLNTMKEILLLYKKRQVQELEKYYYLSFEYLCLFQLKDFEEDDIEVFVPSDPEAPVHFLIRLHIDLHSYFTDFYDDGHDAEENPLLLVTFPDRGSNKSTQRLYLTKNVETLIGVDDTFQLPLEIADHYLTRYIVAIQEELKTKCELSATRFHKRKIYFAKFLSHFDTCVIEYDVLFYTSMVLLLREDDFHFLVEINLPDNYPTETPALIFRSVYHSFMGEPVSAAVDSYPYSSHWLIQKVLEETVKFLAAYAPLFRQDSTPLSCPVPSAFDLNFPSAHQGRIYL